MWTTWIYGLHGDSKKIAKMVYFYKKVEYDDLEEKYTPTGEITPLDLHRPKIDDIIIKDEVAETYHRVKEVLDCWVKSGSMPWASLHYPFENKEAFENSHPADWIIEAQDETRGWFRVLHILSTGIFGKPAFKNVSNSGLIMAKAGRKMSKSKKNYSDPEELLLRELVGDKALSSPSLTAAINQLKKAEVDFIFGEEVGLILAGQGTDLILSGPSLGKAVIALWYRSLRWIATISYFMKLTPFVTGFWQTGSRALTRRNPTGLLSARGAASATRK